MFICIVKLPVFFLYLNILVLASFPLFFSTYISIIILIIYTLFVFYNWRYTLVVRNYLLKHLLLINNWSFCNRYKFSLKMFDSKIFIHNVLVISFLFCFVYFLIFVLFLSPFCYIFLINEGFLCPRKYLSLSVFTISLLKY